MTININVSMDMTTEDIRAIADAERQQSDHHFIDDRFDEIQRNVRRKFDDEINRMMRDYDRAREEMRDEYKKEVAQMNSDCDREIAEMHKRSDDWGRDHGIK